MLAPDRLAGRPRAIRAEERAYVAEPYRDLPEAGTLTGQDGEANLERVLALRSDLIVDFGSINDPTPTSRTACGSSPAYPIS